MPEPNLVRDLMSVGVPTCAPDVSISDIARLLLDKGLEAIVVLDEDGHAIGLVGYDELARAYGREDRQQLTAEDIMREDIPQVPPDIPLTTAAQIMRDQGVRVLYLMHNAGGITYPAAVLTYEHLLRHLAARDESDLADLGIKAARQQPLEKFIASRDAARRRSRLSHEE